MVVFPSDGAAVASPVRLEVRVSGVTLKLPAAADPYASHLHFFVDTDPAAVMGPGQPVSMGIPGIFHSDATRLTLHLPPGTHTVWVVLTDNDHVSLTPAASARVHFTVTHVPRTAEQAPLLYQALVDGHWRLYVLGGADGEGRPLTDGPWDDIDPAWSPDGSRIAFVSNREGRFHLYVMDAAGGEPRQLTRAYQRHIDPSWSPDGRRIAIATVRENRSTIVVMSADGTEARQLTVEDVDRHPAWSPDGRQIAFASGREGQQQIFAVDVETGAIRRLTDGFAHSINPAWPRR